MISLARRVAAEAVGSGLLLTAVIGSGIMAERLTAGNVALALLANAAAVGAALLTLITIFAPISQAHFNPVVSCLLAARRQLTMKELVAVVAAQFIGAVAGVWWAHVMFGLPILQASLHAPGGPGPWAGEFTATFGLVLIVEGGRRHFAGALPGVVAIFLMAAYWFTPSTSLANPAVTVARALTETFARLGVNDIAPFIIAQALGGCAGAVFSRWLYRPLAT